MIIQRKTLAWIYGLVALLALIGTWGNNIHYMSAGLSPLDVNILFWKETFANPASRSITVDLLFLSIPVTIWMMMEARRLQMRGIWIYLIGSLLIAISVTVPLFMAIYAQTMQNIFAVFLVSISINVVFRSIRKRSYTHLAKNDRIKVRVESARQRFLRDLAGISNLVPILKKTEKDLLKKSSSIRKYLIPPELSFSFVLISFYGFSQFPNWIDAVGAMLSLALTYYFLRKSLSHYIESLLPTLTLRAALLKGNVDLGKFPN